MEGMFAILTPLHEKIAKVTCLSQADCQQTTDVTEREKEFNDLFGKDLQDAWEWWASEIMLRIKHQVSQISAHSEQERH